MPMMVYSRSTTVQPNAHYAPSLLAERISFLSDRMAAERAAAMYSLIGSAKLNGLNPELYLRTVLTRIADHPINRIAELLPWNLASSIKMHSSQAA